MKLTALLTALALLGMGCASTYRPMEPGRVSFVWDPPGLSLYKDGVTYGASGLSSAPVRAVAGNPTAEEHARIFVGRSRLFWALYAIGVGCLVTSVAVDPHEPGHDGRRDLAAGFAIGGLAALTAGLVSAFTGYGHLYDAVNIYNDGSAKRVQP
jgi:hypothetical protein